MDLVPLAARDGGELGDGAVSLLVTRPTPPDADFFCAVDIVVVVFME